MAKKEEDNSSLPRQRSIRGADGQLIPQAQLRSDIMGEWADKKKQIRDRWPVKAVVEVFYMCKGVWSDICYALDCSNSQLAKWLDENPDHKEDLAKAKVGIVEQAEETVANLLHSENERMRLEAAKLILTKLGKEYGWSGMSNITNVQVNLNDDKTAQIKAVFGIPETRRRKEAVDVVDVVPEAIANQAEAFEPGAEAGEQKR